MQHLDTVAVVTALALSTRRGHMALEVPIGSDIGGLADTLSEEALECASRTGSAIIAFTGSADAAIAYSDVERRMCLVPGGTVTLVQEDGTVSTRTQDLGNLVVHDFGAAPALPLARAA